MNNHDAQFEIQRQFKERQEKFVYYQIALCVTAIGFSIVQTINVKLECNLIFVALAVIFWAGSIFCGFQFIQIQLKGLIANNNYFDTIAGHVGNLNPSPLVEEVATEIVKEKVGGYSNRSHRNFMFQQYFFYLGIISFIVWHILRIVVN